VSTEYYSRFALSSFSFCAIATSFLGTGLSQIHELHGVNVLATRPFLLRMLALAPATAALFLPPDIFIMALSTTGLYANPILWWFLPFALFMQQYFISSEKQHKSSTTTSLLQQQIQKPLFDDVLDVRKIVPRLEALNILILYENAKNFIDTTTDTPDTVHIKTTASVRRRPPLFSAPDTN